MGKIRKRLTFANVVSCLALFIALGGASYAATQLPKNSVGTKQLKSNAVVTKKIKKNAVSRAKIRKGAINTARLKGNAVTTAKLQSAAITAAKIKAGAVGATQIGANAVGNPQTEFIKVFKGGVVAAAASEAAAPKVGLGSVGPFSFYGKCFQVAGGKVQEKTYIELTSGQATLGSEDGAEMPTNLTQEYLSPTTPEANRAMEDDSIAELNKASAISADEEFQATATDGTQITGLIGGTAAKSGAPAIGNGPFLAGDSCIVGAIAVFGG